MAEPIPAAVLDDRQRLTQQILAGFSGTISHKPVSVFYRLGMLAVAFLMVLLPLIYLAIIALACYGMYLHATHNQVLFEGRGNKKGALLIYLGPLVAGAILLVFMIKPLFARPAKRAKGLSLRPAQEPLLFQFVERLCRSIGAPVPSEIQIDSQVNASAGFRRGLWSLLSNDLVLTIGLPLAGGLSLREFAGVLGHEFGHFSQRAGMRLTYIIRSINAWFARVVYERDEWDETLYNWSKEMDIRIGVVFYAARFCVWLTRKILWVLMIIGHTVSCFMLRQMEYDADSVECAVAGNRAFEATMHRLQILSVATRGAYQYLGEWWKEGRLANDFTALVLAILPKLPKETVEKIRAESNKLKTGLFDTHPADTDRIRAGKHFSAEGMFSLELPATVLFSRFGELSQKSTLELYSEQLDQKIKPENLFATAELLKNEDQERQGTDVLKRYLQGQFSRHRPVQLPALTLTPPQDVTGAVAAIRNAREQMLSSVQPCAEALAQLAQTEKHLIAHALKDVAKKVDISSLSLQLPIQAPASLNTQREKLIQRVEPYEDCVRQRLFTALSLLQVPAVLAKINNGTELRQEVEQLLPMLMLLNKILPNLNDMAIRQQAVALMLESIQAHQNDEEFVRSLLSRVERIRGLLRQIRENLGTVAYPFAHVDKKMTLSKFAVPHVPLQDKISETLQASDACLDKVLSLYVRILSHLATAAEAVESAVGLAPLPEWQDATLRLEVAK